MFSGTVIGFIVAISSGTWIYTKVMRRTGDNTRSAVMTSVIAGIFIFIITLTVVSLVDGYLGDA